MFTFHNNLLYAHQRMSCIEIVNKLKPVGLYQTSKNISTTLNMSKSESVHEI